jgi:hypothetical protein
MSDDASRDVDDVRRALAMTWKGEMRPITSEELVRIWCYDTQWFEASVADSAIAALVENGWLEMTGQGLVPCIDTAAVTAPLGWWPRLESLTNPPLFTAGKATAAVSTDISTIISEPCAVGTGDSIEGEGKSTSPTAATELAPATTKPPDEQDPRMQLVPHLVKYIARKSALEVTEIERRVHRKQRALGPITPWLCLIFIAKEQGLAVDDIIEMFE